VSKSGSNEAAQARADEQRRQDRIRGGTNAINAIFDGGTYRPIVDPTGGPIDWSSGNYYDVNGNRLTGRAKQFDSEVVFGDEVTKPGQFTEDFFNQRRQSFIDYAKPQVDQQYGDAQKELTFALARGGLLDSSVRGQKSGELQRMFDLESQNVADQALAYETQARTGVEDARQNLIATLNATGDTQGAINSALARSTALSQSPAYSPLGQLFSDFTANLGVSAAQDRAASMSGGWYRPGQSSNFTSGAGRVQVN
jgi:hypothetical protein